MKRNNFILTGFDRSGTSAISRTLALHPQVELVFRPFNGGSIRSKMYDVLSNESVSDEDIHFFSELEKGRFDAPYVKSWWHKKYSTITDHFLEDQIHVVITNLNHFTIPWVASNFPKIESWAIWREPLDIIQSCIDNHFLGDWYADALTQVKATVRNNDFLRQHFLPYESLLNDDIKKTAYLLAVRNTFLFHHIELGKLIDYELFKNDPNAGLMPLLTFFGLDVDFDFTVMLERDLNSVLGKVKYSPGQSKKYTFSAEHRVFFDELLAPLYAAYASKKI